MNLKREIAFLLLMSFILASMTIAIPVLAGTTYYVSTTGNDADTGLSLAHAWRHIQYAVNTVGSGDIIIVAPGIYVETVKIDKLLTLTGQSGAVIQPDNTTPLYDGTRRPAVYITADGVTVQGFEIDGTQGTVHQGIYGFNTDGLTIQDNVIHDMSNDAADVGGVGILVFGWDDTVNNNLITGNAVYNTARMGIFVGGMQSADSKWIISSGNTISYNEAYNTWQGPTADGGGAIQVNGAKNTLIANNKIHDTTTGTGFYVGIYVYASSTGNSILRNDVYNNKEGIVAWINPDWAVFGSDVPAAPAVHDNNIYGNTNRGVWNVNSPSPPLVIDATHNWWGDASGPYHATSWLYLGNPYGPHLGSGDSVTDYVLYDPWLSEPWPPKPVGGEWVPINTLQMLVQLVGSVAAISAIAASFVGFKRIKKKQN